MYEAGKGAAPIIVAAILPNTGGSSLVNIALSVGAGLATWGVLYAHNSRQG